MSGSDLAIDGTSLDLSWLLLLLLRKLRRCLLLSHNGTLACLTIQLTGLLLLHHKQLLLLSLGLLLLACLVLTLKEPDQLCTSLLFGLMTGDVRVVLGKLRNHLRRRDSRHGWDGGHGWGGDSSSSCDPLLQLLLLKLLLLLLKRCQGLLYLNLRLSVAHDRRLDTDRSRSGCGSNCRRVEQRAIDRSCGHDGSTASQDLRALLLLFGCIVHSRILVIEGATSQNGCRGCCSARRVS